MSLGSIVSSAVKVATGGIIGGISAGPKGAATGALGALGGAVTDYQNIENTKDAREWQERMANTTHQRNVRDLQAAGLNPALAYAHGGSGASFPSTSIPMMSNPTEGATRALSTAAGVEKIEAEIPLLQAQTANEFEKIGLTKQEAKNASIMYWQLVHLNQKTIAERDLAAAKVEGQDIANKMKSFDLETRVKTASAIRQKIIADASRASSAASIEAVMASLYNGPHGETLAWTEKIMETFGRIVPNLGLFIGKKKGRK